MDYKKMYFGMFNEISRAIEELERCNYGMTREILINAQIKGEEAYIENDPDSEAK